MVLAFLYVPLVIVVLNSFNKSRTFTFPPTGFTLKWWDAAAHSEGALDALWTSVRAGLGATAIALVLGTMAAFAVQRYRFFGRSTVSFLVMLPIALPGIVTGIALNAAFSSVLDPLGIGFGLTTVIIGHATFCIVIVFNNVAGPAAADGRLAGGGVRRPRRHRLADLPHVTLPGVRGALVAGGLLAFGLSFDEIVVTTFTASPDVQTLPLWIFGNLFRPNQAPVVNVVAAVLIVVAVLPVWLAQRLSDDAAGSRV